MPRKRNEHPILSDEALQLVSSRFRMLADPTRLRILNTLMQGESSVGALAERTELEQPCVSRHLALLRREGIVVRRSDGNRVYYRIDDPTVIQLCAVVCGALAERLSDDLDALPDVKAWMGAGI
jgi:DNA-binding transcriptional ArsR family regulator